MTGTNVGCPEKHPVSGRGCIIHAPTPHERHQAMSGGRLSSWSTGSQVAYGIPEGQAIEELTEAIRHTVEYLGTDTLPPVEGWSWYDALVKYAPEKAAVFKEGTTHWWGNRLVRGSEPTVCVHNVGLTPGLWCGGCVDAFVNVPDDTPTGQPEPTLPDPGKPESTVAL